MYVFPICVSVCLEVSYLLGREMCVCVCRVLRRCVLRNGHSKMNEPICLVYFRWPDMQNKNRPTHIDLLLPHAREKCMTCLLVSVCV